MANRGQNAGAGNRVRIPVREFAAKFKSKHECYSFMTQDLASYQPEESCTVTHFLQKQINGQKGFIKAHEVNHLTVPQYETLTLEEMFKWVRAHYELVINRYFPSD